MKPRKIGIWTTAIGLIAVGVIIILHISSIVSIDALKYLWPLLLILFGIEVVAAQFRSSEQKVRFSGWGAVLLIVLLLFSIAQSAVPGLSGSLFSPKYMSAVNGTVDIDNSIKHVEVQIPEGKITVTGTDSSTLNYDGKMKSAAKSQSEADQFVQSKWKVQKSGDTLQIIYDQSELINIFSLSFLDQSKQPYLNIQLPNRLMTDVNTSNGSVTASLLNADITMTTSNGSVKADHIKGNVTAKSSNGSITVGQIEGSADVNTSNGSVTLDDITGTVTARSSNGAIRGDSPVLSSWSCRTSNGSINLTIPADTNGTFTADTSNGSIKGDVQWNKNDDNDHGTAVLGNGANKVTLNTSNGSINVNFAP
ncbi:DUF4097 domain-containing protein [Paenibacillus sediminis]|uniref:DUF4097 domain-containing protein n=1 Tax=Paenibacillus sediminis TaxID=664909 RepID=A0ABS4H2G1_9BACL|nr:DUF4097 family beta strand repeat-containing protein [Paenibacillus sediminis]MBP1936722.1 hypothetical protein [Paenibacillus sediminis]